MPWRTAVCPAVFWTRFDQAGLKLHCDELLKHPGEVRAPFEFDGKSWQDSDVIDPELSAWSWEFGAVCSHRALIEGLVLINGDVT